MVLKNSAEVRCSRTFICAARFNYFSCRPVDTPSPRLRRSHSVVNPAEAVGMEFELHRLDKAGLFGNEAIQVLLNVSKTKEFVDVGTATIFYRYPNNRGCRLTIGCPPTRFM
jgi:hypothetical protein